MLENIRRASGSYWFRGFLLVLAVSFAVLWSVGDMLFQRGTPSQTLISVGKERINAQDFVSRVQREWAGFQMQIGREIPFEEAKKTGILDALFSKVSQEIIEKKLIELEADRLNIVIPDKMVKDFIQSQSQLHENGQYSERLLREVLSRLHLSQVEFINQVRGELKQQLLMRPLLMNLRIPNQINGPIYAWALEEREIALISTEGLKLPEPIVPPQEDTLRNFYEMNAQLYVLPESRHMDLLVVDAQVVSVKPSKEEILALYKKYKADGGDKPLKEVESMLVGQFKQYHGADQIFELAGRIQDKLAEGQTLDEVAQSHKLKVVRYEKLKMKDFKLLPNSFSDQTRLDVMQNAFGQGETDLPAQVRTENGEVVFVKTTHITPAQQQEYKDVKAQAAIDWMRREELQKKREFVQAKYAEIQKDPALFQKLWKENPKFQDQYKTRRDGPVHNKDPRFSPSNALLQAAFSGKENHVFMVDTGNHVLIGQVKKIERPYAKLEGEMFDNFKERVTRTYANDVSNLYMGSLRRRYRVEVDQQLLAHLKNSISSHA